MENKRTIKAADIIGALNKGIPVAQLMREFNLSRIQFDTMLQKLKDKGVLSQAVLSHLQNKADVVSRQVQSFSQCHQASEGDRIICQQIEQALDRLLSAGNTR